jgi:hypothetical protein
MYKGISLISLLVTFSLADQIELKSGEIANVTILDTSGCDVVYSKNGTVIEKRKNRISSIVWKSDTISYVKFLCTQEIGRNKTTKIFEDGFSPDRVDAMISKLKTRLSDLRECTVYYCTDPVFGNDFDCCWKEQFAKFETELKSKYASIKPINRDELFNLLKSTNDTNCVLMPFRVTFGYSDSKGIIGDLNVWDGLGRVSVPAFPGGPQDALAKAAVNIKIVDLKSHLIVFDDTSSYKIPFATSSLFNSATDNINNAKKACLENALLNSIDKVRAFFTNLLNSPQNSAASHFLNR